MSQVSKVDKVLQRLIADINDNMEFIDSSFNSKDHAQEKVIRSLYQAKQELLTIVLEALPEKKHYKYPDLQPAERCIAAGHNKAIDDTVAAIKKVFGVEEYSGES